jgi:hemerythrin
LRQLSWIDAFETGSPEIDAVHRQLIDDCNRLLLLIDRQEGWPAIITEASGLVERCVAHFRLEESALVQNKFPRCADHAAEHRRVERKMRRLMGRMEKGDGSLAEHRELPAALVPLLIDFMVRHDLDFRSHLLYQQGR